MSRTCAPHPQNSLDIEAFFASCHAAPGVQDHGRSSDDSNPGDFWEYDDLKSAWKMNHVRPRKRLYAPVGKDCPFSADEIGLQRVTEWKCKGVVSVYKDNWQVHPHQRISSKSWVGATWFFPNKKVDYDHAKVQACQANIARSDGTSKRFAKRSEHFLASASLDHPSFAAQIQQAAKGVEQVKPSKARKARGSNSKVMFEFCCSEDSALGKANEERNIDHFRLTEKSSDMADDEEVRDLLKVMKLFPGADLWGSIPCGPWSRWQDVNLAKGGKGYAKRLKAARKKSMKILKNYIRCAEQVLLDGGHVCFEWPRGCSGWSIPELVKFIKKHDLFVAEPDGCAFGLKDNEGNPHYKPWRIVTSSYQLARNLDAYKCSHPPDFKHSHLAGSKTPKSAFYTDEMAQCISHSLYPEIVPSMPVKPMQPEPHHQPTAVEVDAGIHLLIDRKDWHKHEGYLDAIKKERDGVLENGTWNYDEVVPRDELMKRKEHINIGRIMTILSVKHWETPALRKLKARIVFRGDDIRDNEGNLAVLLESKVNPTGMAGINANLAYGSLPGHKTTQSDVVRAYLQSWLGTKVPTWVELSPELVPDEFKHIKRPCVRLWRSLYGHPEAGHHWDMRFREVMTYFDAKHIDTFQSNFWIPKYKLLLSLYVDDVVVSGPSSQHKLFWDEMQRHLELDEPAEVSRILGREHSISRSKEGTTCAFEMTEFIDNCCELYETLSKRKLKPAASPYVNDGSLTDSDWDVKGSLSAEASRILMKVLWCARLARPDLNKAISDLTRRLTCWSVADDKRLHRLMSYLYGSRKFTLKGYIGDPPELLRLCCYTDADHCSAQEDTKSTSGMIMTLEGPHSWWPLSWASRKQTSTARSTTEAEMVSLGAGLFLEALPMQELLETILGRQVELVCYQDNSAVIQIVAAGYSPKLRHLNKTFRINIGSIHEVFKENDDCLLLYIKTAMQRADPFTKPLPVAKWPEALQQLNVQVST